MSFRREYDRFQSVGLTTLDYFIFRLYEVQWHCAVPGAWDELLATKVGRIGVEHYSLPTGMFGIWHSWILAGLFVFCLLSHHTQSRAARMFIFVSRGPGVDPS